MIKLAVRTQQLLNRAQDPDRGATAVEYGLIVALIAAIIIGTVAVLGRDINAAFQSVVNGL